MADGAEFKAQLRLEIDNTRELLKSLQEIAKRGGDDLDASLVKAIDAAVAKAGILKRTLNFQNSDKQLETMRSSTAQMASNGAKLAAQIQRAGAVNISAFDAGKLRQAETGLRKMNQQISQQEQGWQKTSLHSQNVLRVIQDAPFGMLGMGNNIQVLSESFARLRAEGKGIGEIAKTMFLPLVAGPMAIAAVVTLVTTLVTSWDRIVATWDKAKKSLGLLTEGQLALNEAIREFNSIENFEQFAKGLDFDQLEKAASVYRGELNAAQEALQNEFGIVDEKAIENRFKALKTLLTVALPTVATDAVMNSEMAAIKRVQSARDKLNAVMAAQRAKMDDENRQRAIGIETDRDKEARELAEKRRKEQAKADEDAVDLWRDLEEDAIKDVEAMQKESAERMADTNAEFEKEKLGLIKSNIQIEEQLRREALKREAEAIRNILGTARHRIATLQFNTPGQFADDNAPVGERVAAARARGGAQAEGQLQEMLALQRAARLSSDAETKQELLRQADIAGMQMLDTERRTQEEITKIYEQAAQTRMQLMSTMAGAVGDSFTNLSTIMGSESEKGFEQHKGMMKAAAVADAIAASIAVYRNHVQAGIANPLAAITAGAQAAAVLTGLMAQIRKIDSAGTSSTSFSAPTGKWTALNSNVTKQRAANFTQQQSRIDSSTRAEQGENLATAIKDVGNKIQDQRVILDEPTAAKAAMAGTNRNNRRIQMTK